MFLIALLQKGYCHQQIYTNSDFFNPYYHQYMQFSNQKQQNNIFCFSNSGLMADNYCESTNMENMGNDVIMTQKTSNINEGVIEKENDDSVDKFFAF